MAISQTGQAVQGGMSGAAAGSAVMPGWGTAIGAVAGAVIPSLFQSKGDGFNQEALDMEQSKRLSSISVFSDALTAARANYDKATQNMQSLAFNRFMPNIEAQYAGRGLNVTGGAFQSSLGKEIANLQASANVNSWQGQMSDLSTAESMRQAAYSQWMSQSAGVGQQQNAMAYGQNQALGGLSAQFITPQSVGAVTSGIGSLGSSIYNYMSGTQAQQPWGSPQTQTYGNNTNLGTPNTQFPVQMPGQYGWG